MSGAYGAAVATAINSHAYAHSSAASAGRDSGESLDPLWGLLVLAIVVALVILIEQIRFGRKPLRLKGNPMTNPEIQNPDSLHLAARDGSQGLVRRLRVYIASPYTKGDVAVNVKRQLDMADELMTLGYAPFAPLYSHFQHMAHPRPYQDWIDIDLEWVTACDVLLRLEGESSGADGEEAFAHGRGIPVVHSVQGLLEWFPPRRIQSHGHSDVTESGLTSEARVATSASSGTNEQKDVSQEPKP